MLWLNYCTTITHIWVEGEANTWDIAPHHKMLQASSSLSSVYYFIRNKRKCRVCAREFVRSSIVSLARVGMERNFQNECCWDYFASPSSTNTIDRIRNNFRCFHAWSQKGNDIDPWRERWRKLNAKCVCGCVFATIPRSYNLIYAFARSYGKSEWKNWMWAFIRCKSKKVENHSCRTI